MANEPTPEMRWLVESAEEEIDTLMGALEFGGIDTDAWEDEFQQILTRNHLGSWMLGQASENMDYADLAEAAILIKLQLQYLSNFKLVIRSSIDFMPGWYERAEMYASAMNQTYWSGRMKIWPLPAMPGQGTICLSRCRCSWREDAIDIDNGDGDFYWELDPYIDDERHCQTCLQRADEWSPVRIRNGELQI